MPLSNIPAIRLQGEKVKELVDKAIDDAANAPSVGQPAVSAAIGVQFTITDAQAALTRMLLMAGRSEDAADDT